MTLDAQIKDSPAESDRSAPRIPVSAQDGVLHWELQPVDGQTGRPVKARLVQQQGQQHQASYLDGGFLIRIVSESPTDVTLAAVGYFETRVTLPRLAPIGGPQVVPMQAVPDRLATIIVLDPHGVGAKGARVHAWTARGEGRQPDLLATCDDNGHAKVGLAGVQYVSATGQRGLVSELVRVSSLDIETPIHLTLTEGCLLMAVDATSGEPLPDITLSLWPTGGLGLALRTDRLGCTAVHVAVGSYGLSASAGDGPRKVGVAPGEWHTELELRPGMTRVLVESFLGTELVVRDAESHEPIKEVTVSVCARVSGIETVVYEGCPIYRHGDRITVFNNSLMHRFGPCTGVTVVASGWLQRTLQDPQNGATVDLVRDVAVSQRGIRLLGRGHYEMASVAIHDSAGKQLARVEWAATGDVVNIPWIRGDITVRVAGQPIQTISHDKLSASTMLDADVAGVTGCVVVDYAGDVAPLVECLGSYFRQHPIQDGGHLVFPYVPVGVAQIVVSGTASTLVRGHEEGVMVRAAEVLRLSIPGGLPKPLVGMAAGASNEICIVAVPQWGGVAEPALQVPVMSDGRFVFDDLPAEPWSIAFFAKPASNILMPIDAEEVRRWQYRLLTGRVALALNGGAELALVVEFYERDAVGRLTRLLRRRVSGDRTVVLDGIPPRANEMVVSTAHGQVLSVTPVSLIVSGTITVRVDVSSMVKNR